MPRVDQLRGADDALADLLPAHCPVCDVELERHGLHGRDRLVGIPGRFAVLTCPECGLGLTSPGLSDEQLAAHYPDDYPAYSSPRGGLARMIERFRRWQMDRRLRRPPYKSMMAGEPGRVLDVGCGRGDFAAAFLRRGWHAAGLDISTDAIEQARGRGVEAHAGTLESVPWESGSFDLVVMFHSLEHMRDPAIALRQAAGLLRPGGRLVVTVPNFGSWQSRLFGSCWYPLDLPRHRVHFTRASLLRAAARAGLVEARVDEIISIEGTLGSLQYALAGRCLFRPPWLWPALGVAVLLYPVTWVPGRLRGGDWARLSACRPV